MPTWTGRRDSQTPERIHQLIKVETPATLTKKFALLGFASHEGVLRNQGRVGAQEGPMATRKALANLAWSSPKECSLADVGDVTCVDGDLEGASQKLRDAVSEILGRRATPIVLGGGHETAWGHFLGIWQGLQASGQKPHPRVGIINFDAHFDLRPLLPGDRGTSGTPFLQIAKFLESQDVPFDYTVIGIQEAGNTPSLFKTAQDLGVSYVCASEIHCEGAGVASQLIQDSLERNDYIYLTLCLDVFAEAYAPGVSAPQALGLTPCQVLGLWKEVFASGKVVSCDLVELSPPHDPTGATARLAAQMVLHGLIA